MQQSETERFFAGRSKKQAIIIGFCGCVCVTCDRHQLGAAAHDHLAADGPDGVFLLHHIERVGDTESADARHQAELLAGQADLVAMETVKCVGNFDVVKNGHLEHGMEILTKPFTIHALISKVSDIMRGR